ncbi:MAG: M20/M25/M40 family metallo-hydrolase [Planctomycetota bacterium]
MTFFTVCLLVLGSGLHDTESSTVDRIIEIGRTDNHVQEHLDHMVNRIGPRLTGSDSLQTACEWAVERFKSFGIENARLERWGEVPVGFNRGPWSGRIVSPIDRPLRFGTNAWTAGTTGKESGRVLRVPENEEQLAQMVGLVDGAWMLGRIPRDLREPLEAAGMRGEIRATRDDLILTGGRYRITWDTLPTRPEINLMREDYQAIEELLDQGEEVVLEFDIRNYFKEGPVDLYNVIADIPGTELPDEYVIVGGHIDSWDGATGTTDNGTGCATTFEAARLLMESGAKPKRTIRFMLWSGEEQGLLGSRAYCDQHEDLMEKISAVLVHDGGTNYLSGITATAAMMEDFEKVFAPVIELDERFPFSIREVEGLRGGGSDHNSFLGKGVPGFFWNQSGDAVYRYTHHTQHDTFESAIPDYQKHSSMVAAIGALGIANLDHKLSRENMQAQARAARGGRLPRRLLGVRLDDMTISDVTEDGKAGAAGLKAGDVLVQIDDTKVADAAELRQALRGGEPKKKVTVRRGEEMVTVTIDWSDVEGN